LVFDKKKKEAVPLLDRLEVMEAEFGEMKRLVLEHIEVADTHITVAKNAVRNATEAAAEFAAKCRGA